MKYLPLYSVDIDNGERERVSENKRERYIKREGE